MNDNTPRTDEAARNIRRTIGNDFAAALAFARDLERELNQTRERLRFLQNASLDLLAAMDNWSDEAIDTAIAMTAAEKGLIA